MFEVVSPQPIHKIWMPVDANATTGETLYVGQIVTTKGDGVAPLGAASGIANLTAKKDKVVNDGTGGVPFGIVTGTNLKEPNDIDTTYYVEYITSEHTTHTNYTATKALHDGIGVAKGEKHAMVQVALLCPSTIIKGPIYNATYGTALTEISCGTGNTSGVKLETAGGWGANGIADMRTFYCTSGANAGLYRISDDTTSTANTFDSPWPYDISASDKFVAVNLRRGTSLAQFDTESMCILQAATTTDYYLLDVLHIDLSDTSNPYAIFKFNAYNFIGHDGYGT